MSRATVAHIDLDALTHNYHADRRRICPRTRPAAPPRVIAVVKANAYGHGAVPVARALERGRSAACWPAPTSKKPWCCATAGVDVPHPRVRRPQPHRPRRRLPPRSDAQRVVADGRRRRAGRRRAHAASACGCHLKIDTGMNRLGFRHDNLDRMLPGVLAAPNLALEAVYTHFATADVPGDDLFGLQRTVSPRR